MTPRAALEVSLAAAFRAVELGEPLRLEGFGAAGSFAGDDGRRENRELLERRLPCVWPP